jgi:rhodanese-related sulfurtransferase
MPPKLFLLILFGVLLISAITMNGCSNNMPASSVPVSQASGQTTNSSSSSNQPNTTSGTVSLSTTPQASASPVVTPTVPAISVQDAFILIQNNKNNPDFIILDVRTADEFNSGHLEGAINIDYYADNFKANVDKLERSKEYLVYCRSGIRGAFATQIMLDLGFTRVHNMTGAITQWTNAGYPIVK